MYISHSPAETQAFAQKVAQRLHAGDVIAYRGGLGVGKTCFTRGLAEGLGCRADEVSSPTFALVNEYDGGRLPLVHFDMYRIEGFEDLYSTGFFDYLEQQAVLAIEWSENIEQELPQGTIWIGLERIDDDTRRITVEGGERFEDLGDR